MFAATNPRRRRRRPACRSAQPRLEGLEDRKLLYAVTGGAWPHPGRITYSFMPDGTSIGGISSRLFQTLDAQFSRSVWQAQFQRAAAVWAAIANINLVQVGDDGTPVGHPTGLQQGDSRFGDIRIGAFAMGPGALGSAIYPPPQNGGSEAGDIFLNSSAYWNVNGTYDIQTVAIHEIGHALGMSHSSIANAVMFASYNGIKQSLNIDDVNGIRSIYGGRESDVFDAVAPGNGSSGNATDITSFLTSNAQVALPNLDISSTSDLDWFRVTVPANTSGTLVVTMQSTGLSSLSPSLRIHNAAGTQIASATGSSSTYGATLTLTVQGVAPNQTYFIRAASGTTAVNGVGAYGLLVNLGSSPQAPIAPPNTAVPPTSGLSGEGWGNLSTWLPPGLAGRPGGLPPGLANGFKFDPLQLGTLRVFGDMLMEPGQGKGPSPARAEATALAAASPSDGVLVPLVLGQAVPAGPLALLSTAGQAEADEAPAVLARVDPATMQ